MRDDDLLVDLSGKDLDHPCVLNYYAPDGQASGCYKQKRKTVKSCKFESDSKRPRWCPLRKGPITMYGLSDKKEIEEWQKRARTIRRRNRKRSASR